MEILMLLDQVDHAENSLLRFIFSDRVVSFSLAASVTLEEIARTLGELTNQGYGDPVAIDVTLGSHEGDAVRRMICPPRLDSSR
jgi:hypothetical protein